MKYAYAVLSVGDLRRMLAEAEKSCAEGMARHKAAGRNPDIATTVWYSEVITIKGNPVKQLGTFTQNEPEIITRGGAQ